MWDHMYEWGPAGGWGWMAGGHVLWWLLLIVALVVLLRWVVQRGGSERGAPEDHALKTLRERFARGEIDQAEFEARKRALDA